MMQKQLFAIALLGGTSLLGGCTATGSAGAYCCYQGNAAASRLADVGVTLEGGRTLPFGALFPDFAPATNFLTPTLPVYRLNIAQVVYPNLAAVLTSYDANDDGFIEGPELTVLYMSEAARGLDQPVSHLGGEPPLGAINATSADIGGLVQFVSLRRSDMSPAARKTFDELDMLRGDFRLDGTEPGEQGGGDSFGL